MKNNHGGKRKGAGRPVQGIKKAVDSTIVARINKIDYHRLKTAAYSELLFILHDYRLQIEEEPGARTSPRYEKLRQMLDEVEEILGDDYDSWIDY